MPDWTVGYPYRVITALAGGDIGPARRCQFPVGGQGAATRFCGRPAQRGTSYCARHRRRCVAAVGDDPDAPAPHCQDASR